MEPSHDWLGMPSMPGAIMTELQTRCPQCGTSSQCSVHNIVRTPLGVTVDLRTACPECGGEWLAEAIKTEEREVPIVWQSNTPIR